MKATLALLVTSLVMPLIILLLFLGFFIYFLGWLFCNKLLKLYGFVVLYAIDQLGNAFLMGKPDDTISMRVSIAIASGKPKWFVRPFGAIIDKVFLSLVGDRDHIADSITDYTGDKELWSWQKKD